MSLSLNLHKRLYPRAAVTAAVEAYGDFALIQVQNAHPYTTVVFDEVDPDVDDVIIREFANFALAEAIEMRR